MIQNFSTHSLLHSEPSPAFNHVFIVYFVIEHWASTAKLWYYTNYYGVHFKVLQYFLNKWMYRKILNVSRLAERIYAKQFWHSSRITGSVQFSSVQSLSRVRLFATPWITALQASLSITNSWSSLRLTAIESVMPSSHLILCRPLLLLPSIPPSIRVFSNKSILHMRKLLPLSKLLEKRVWVRSATMLRERKKWM